MSTNPSIFSATKIAPATLEEVADLLNEGKVVQRFDLGSSEVFKVDHPQEGAVICGVGANAQGFKLA